MFNSAVPAVALLREELSSGASNPGGLNVRRPMPRSVRDAGCLPQVQVSASKAGTPSGEWVPTASRCPALHPHSEEPSGGLLTAPGVTGTGGPKKHEDGNPRAGVFRAPPNFSGLVEPRELTQHEYTSSFPRSREVHGQTSPPRQAHHCRPPIPHTCPGGKQLWRGNRPGGITPSPPQMWPQGLWARETGTAGEPVSRTRGQGARGGQVTTGLFPTCTREPHSACVRAQVRVWCAAAGAHG